MAPKGDGHPVLTLPGFMGGDKSTIAIRRYIGQRGYDTRPWTLGQNLGPRAIGEEGELLAERVLNVYRETRRKVSLVGWSLGGVMAREVAKELPNQVRQVITLGSPFAGHPDSTNVGKLYQRVTGLDMTTPEFQHMMRTVAEPPAHVPSTAIFSKTDGVAHWRSCIERPAPMTDNIEVRASHCGLGVHPLVMYLIAERLALPETDWAPFNRHANSWRLTAFPSSGHGYGNRNESIRRGPQEAVSDAVRGVIGGLTMPTQH